MPKKSELILPRRSMLSASGTLPISPYMVLASGVFWICILFLSYNGIKYLHVFVNLDDSGLATECTSTFEKTTKDNMKIVDNYKKGEAGPYLRRLSPDPRPGTAAIKKTPLELETFPPIVTAVSSEDFWNVQGLIRQVTEVLRTAHGDFQFIIYDLGLYNREAELIKKYCSCEVRRFEKSLYPSHIDTEYAQAWKPIILQKILHDYDSVFWISPSSRVRNVEDLIQLKYRGNRDFLLWETEAFTSLTGYTSPKMFEYFNESRCTFYDAGLVEDSAMVFYRTNLTLYGLMRPWLKCVLNKDCIAPVDSRYSGCFYGRSPKTTGCHRYAQSALSIIINRLVQFSIEADKFNVPKITKMYDEVQYFPEQPWTYTEIMCICSIFIIILCGSRWLIRRRRNIGKPSFFKR